MNELLREFVSETIELIDAAAQDVVALESDPGNAALIDQIFRTVHTIKGSSSFFALPRITALAHVAEDLLSSARDGSIALNRMSGSSILAALTQMRALTSALSADGVEPRGSDDAMIRALQQCAESAEDRSPGDRAADGADGAAPIAPPPLISETAEVAAPTRTFRSVRVPLTLLDDVMNSVSDLVLSRNELGAELFAAGVDISAMPGFSKLSGQIAMLRAAVSRMRMVPIKQLFAPLPRLVRQIADELGRSVDLVIEEGSVEIDREVVEALRDPIIHSIRNAIDHGIEPAAERAAAGKASTGTVRVAARQLGNRIVIDIADDGRGLALDVITRRAVAAGQIAAKTAETLTDDQRAKLIFLPGLSTADTVSAISGRGVGMDVIKTNVEKLGGFIGIKTRAGQGTRLSIDMPMTLTIISALSTTIQGHALAIPRAMVEEVMLASSSAIERHSLGGTALIRIRNRTLPMILIESALGLAPPPDDVVFSEDRVVMLCRAGRDRVMAFNVPELRDHDELVIKSLPPALAALRLYSGITLPDRGAPMLVVDMDAIADTLIGATDQADMLDRDARAAGAENEVAQAPGEQWLTFTPLAGALRRAVPLTSIQRIADVAASDIVSSLGRHFARIDGALLPLVGMDAVPTDNAKLRLLSIGDGRDSALLAVGSIGEIGALAPTVSGAVSGNHVFAIADHGGDLFEMIDVASWLSEHKIESVHP